MSRAFSSSINRFRFCVLATFTCSIAPAEAFATVSVRPTARAVRRAEYRAKISRVLNAVEHDEQRRVTAAVEDVIGGYVCGRRDQRDHALMIGVGACVPQEQLMPSIGERDRAFAAQRDDLGQPVFAGTIGDHHLLDPSSTRPERFKHRKNAVDDTVAARLLVGGSRLSGSAARGSFLSICHVRGNLNMLDPARCGRQTV